MPLCISRQRVLIFRGGGAEGPTISYEMRRLTTSCVLRYKIVIIEINSHDKPNI
jgi:hypothetical protein